MQSQVKRIKAPKSELLTLHVCKADRYLLRDLSLDGERVQDAFHRILLAYQAMERRRLARLGRNAKDPAG